MSLTISRYIRFVVNNTFGNSFETQINEFQLLNADTILDLTHCTATTSPNAIEYSDGSANNAVDGSLNYTDGIHTKWCVYLNPNLNPNTYISPTNPIYLQIVSPTPLSFNKYQFYTGNDTFSYNWRNPISWFLQVSDDGISWTTIDNKINYPTPNLDIALVGPFDLITACFVGDTQILIADKTIKTKKIKDIEIGDLILSDIKKNIINKVLHITKIHKITKAVEIPENLIANKNKIICTHNHLFYINNKPIMAKNILGIKEIYINDYFYNLVFDNRSTYYVEGIKVASLSAHNIISPLYNPNYKNSKILNIQKNKFNLNKIIKIKL